MQNTPWLPDDFSKLELDWAQLVTLIGKAHDGVAGYNGLLESIPNPNVLLMPLATKEAVLSSRIEGTQATFEDVIGHEEDEEEKAETTSNQKDIREVVNYRFALEQSAHTLANSTTISLSLIKRIHQTLMNSVRGRDKNPGNFRNTQNWIGGENTAIEQARFVPPTPIVLAEHLEKWERFMNNDYPDYLVQLAIVHGQFEILHPFVDGNGRIGRLLIPLFLYHKKCLIKPWFYLSEYLEQNRDAYYDGLLAITKKGDWMGWIRFFLQAIISQAEKNLKQSREILNLYDLYKEKFTEATKSRYAIYALDAFFANPKMSSTQFFKIAKFPNKVSSSAILTRLVNANLIRKKKGGGRRPHTYFLHGLIEIASSTSIK